MPTAAAGPISTIEEIAAATLANTAQFQDLTGAANAAAALESIYFDALPPPDSDADSYTLAEIEALRPFAILNTEPQAGFRWHNAGRGAAWTYKTSGLVTIQIEANIDADDLDDPQEYMRLFKNAIGQIISTDDASEPGLLELAGQAGRLPITEVMFYGPFRGAEEAGDAQGNFLWAAIDLGWGFK